MRAGNVSESDTSCSVLGSGIPRTSAGKNMRASPFLGANFLPAKEVCSEEGRGARAEGESWLEEEREGERAEGESWLEEEQEGEGGRQQTKRQERGGELHDT
eukprot:764039-Hanusia_phi.AAC.2